MRVCVTVTVRVCVHVCVCYDRNVTECVIGPVHVDTPSCLTVPSNHTWEPCDVIYASEGPPAQGGAVLVAGPGPGTGVVAATPSSAKSGAYIFDGPKAGRLLHVLSGSLFKNCPPMAPSCRVSVSGQDNQCDCLQSSYDDLRPLCRVLRFVHRLAFLYVAALMLYVSPVSSCVCTQIPSPVMATWNGR